MIEAILDFHLMTFFTALFFKNQENWRKVPLSETSGNSGEDSGSAKFYFLLFPRERGAEKRPGNGFLGFPVASLGSIAIVNT